MGESFHHKRENFWNELCGTNAFRNLGLKEINPESLKIFDSWYMNDMYPYLYKYLQFDHLKDKSVLEIGLGFGTVGERIFLSAKRYIGIDYAQNPVDLMHQRIKYHGKENTAKAIRANAHLLPFDDDTFDSIISIGCLHHTGETHKSVLEIYRVLKKGSKTVIMLYNKNSFRRIFLNPLRYLLLALIRKNKFMDYDEFDRSIYDSDSDGNTPPVTEFVSKKNIESLFSYFQEVSIEIENFDDLYLPKTRIGISRKWLLNNLDKVWGLDLYITARK